MYAGQMQDFRSIKVADSGNRSLIEQRDFDCPAAVAKSFAQLVGRNRQCIWSEMAVAKSLRELLIRSAAARCPARGGPSTRHAESGRSPDPAAAASAPASADRPRAPAPSFAARRSADRRRSSRSTTRFPSRPTSSIRWPASRRARLRGSMAIGRRLQRSRSTPAIRLPAIAAIPRRMVSTSGKSGTSLFLSLGAAVIRNRCGVRSIVVPAQHRLRSAARHRL